LDPFTKVPSTLIIGMIPKSFFEVFGVPDRYLRWKLCYPSIFTSLSWISYNSLQLKVNFIRKNKIKVGLFSKLIG